MSDKQVSNRKQLGDIFKRIDDLIQTGEFEVLDQELKNLRTNMDTIHIAAWLRYSARANGNLPAWPHAVLKFADELERKGLPSQEILMGLLPPKVNAPI